MYYFSSIIDTLGGVSCLFHSVHENAFCIAIETNDYDVRTASSEIGVHELFAEACHRLPSTIPVGEIPTAFARDIDSVLKESGLEAKQGASTEANFAAVASNKSSIFVCTAGICRVHLIQGGRLLQVSRDHNWASDWLPNDAFDGELTFERNPSAFTVPTRVLGHSSVPGFKGPESQTWPAIGEFTVLVCSTDYHRFREPSEYVYEFINQDLSEIARAHGNGEGFMALLKRM